MRSNHMMASSLWLSPSPGGTLSSTLGVDGGNNTHLHQDRTCQVCPCTHMYQKPSPLPPPPPPPPPLDHFSHSVPLICLLQLLTNYQLSILLHHPFFLPLRARPISSSLSTSQTETVVGHLANKPLVSLH